MQLLLKIVVFGRACRNAANIKNRQPIGQMFIKSEDSLPEYYVNIIEEELNVKKAHFTDDVSDFTTYNFKPQLRTVGPKYGKFLQGIKDALSSLDGNKAYSELKANGYITLPDVDDSIKLEEEDLLIEVATQEGFVTDGNNDVTVVLDTNLDEALIEEGFVREIISKIQTMRKDAGFEVMDHIEVAYNGTDRINSIFDRNSEAICKEVLANSLTKGSLNSYSKEWSINKEDVELFVKRV